MTMCSFDKSNLFTNVPLQETINICTASLFQSNLEPPGISEAVFVELTNAATRAVEFSFNDNMYTQVDMWTTCLQSSILLLPALTSSYVSNLDAFHPALKVTCETEQSNVLPFLDVLVEKIED